MPTKRTAAFAAWLDKQLSSLQPGNRLPTGPRLATQWSLSESTVRAILRQYQRDGKLELIPGKGTFIPRGGPEPELVVDGDRSSTQSVVDYVVSSIRRGTLRTGGALPSVKYMTLQFKVAPMTVIKAYGLLQERGLVTRIGKTFWVGDRDRLLSSVDQVRHAWVFNYRDVPRKLYDTGWMSAAYRKLESEMTSVGFRFTYSTVPEFAGACGAWIKKGSIPDAVLFHRIEQEHVEQIAEPLSRLLRFDPNVSVLADLRSGDFRKLPRHRAVRILSRGNIFTTRAKAVADFAIRRNYSRVCFLFDEERASWGRFLPFTRIRAEIEDLDTSCRFVTAVRPLSSSPAPEAFIERLHLRKSPEAISMVLSKYHPASHKSLEQELVFVESLSGLASLAQPGARWLFLHVYEDEAAGMVEALKGHGIKVPRDAGVLSFEDSGACRLAGVSSCVPDWEQIGYLMAHAIIGDFPVARTGKGFVRVKVDVMERATT